MKYSRGDSEAIVMLVVFLVCGLFTVGCFWAYPNYNVWAEELSGKAKLAEAQSSRKIAIEEARAEEESAKFKANAEITRATGVAEANRIIGDSLKGNEAYLRYLWIDNLEKGENDVIYVPTEASLPILEATRGKK